MSPGILRGLFCLALVAVAGNTVVAQVPITQVEGSRLECPDSLIADCAENLEKHFNVAHPEITRRNPDESLSVQILSGRWVTPENQFSLYDYAIELLQDGRYLAILSFGEEDLFWKLLDRKTGATFRMEGYPLFSPDGRHVVSAERDEMNLDALDVYEVRASGLARVFQAIPPTPSWFPERVCWVDNATIAYTRRAAEDTAGKLGTPESVALKRGRWRIEAGGPRCTKPF